MVIQTYNPEHPAVLSASRQDYAGFYADELRLREELAYPPFSHLVNVIWSGEDETAVREAAARTAHGLEPEMRRIGAALLGPAPCAIARIHRKHRWHLTFKARKVQEIVPLVRNFLARDRSSTGVNVTIDADPVSML